MVIGDYLTECNNRIGQREAEIIFLSVFETNTLNLFMGRKNLLDDENHKKIENMVCRVEDGEPVQYVVGETEFMGLPFKVTPDVLIPRADTESVVEEALSYAKDADKLLDICTGSGCIGISLAKLCEGLNVTCLDISEKALDIVDENAKLNEVNIHIIQADILKYTLKDKYDIIISNPPYIQSDVIPTLDINVKDFEPHLALDGGEDGLRFYRRIAKIAKQALNPNGILIFEIGYDQGKTVPEILKAEGYKNIQTKKDYADNDRIVIASL